MIKLFFGYINKVIETLKVDGLWILFTRLYNYFFVLGKRLIFNSAFKKRYRKVVTLQNSKLGKTLFILGNGPSLNHTPLYLLKGQDTFCFNRVNLLFDKINWTPTYYMITDDLVVQDMRDEIGDIVSEVDKAFFPDLHPSNIDFTKIIDDKSNIFWIDTCHPNFSKQLPKVGINKTVVNVAIQIGVYMGYSKICLMGVDVNYVSQNVTKSNRREWKAENDDDPNHFDPRYFGKNRSYHNPSTDEMISKFKEAKEFFRESNVEIINTGVGGKLELFRRSSIQDELRLSRESITSLFIESLNFELKKCEFEKFISSKEEKLTLVDSCYLTKEPLSIEKIKLMSLDYRLIGPCYGVYAIEKII